MATLTGINLEIPAWCCVLWCRYIVFSRALNTFGVALLQRRGVAQQQVIGIFCFI